jgi:YgiT-type zinc finger domain-containing protein
MPGGYEEREVKRTVRHRGRAAVIDRVPTEVCSVCGETLLKPYALLCLSRVIGALGGSL